jgi:hypothetical protein
MAESVVEKAPPTRSAPYWYDRLLHRME